VLHILGGLDRGGAETRTMDIYRSIDKTKVQFDFIVQTDNECAYDNEVKSLGGIIYKGMPRFKIYNSISYFKAWDMFFQKNGYSIIHIHITNSAVPILKAAIKNNIKHRISHSRFANETDFVKKWLIRANKKAIRKYSTQRLAVSNLAGKTVFGKDYMVINNAINAKKFTYDETVRDKVRNELNIVNNFVLCHVGRFSFPKNHSFLIDIFHSLTKVLPSAKLVLIGDGELREQTERKIEELRISDKVLVLGLRKDVPELLHGMDMLLLPSHFEGQPGVALEAQASGLKVLLSDKITREAAVIPELTEFLPIDKGADIWVERIMNFHESGFVRRNTYNDFVNAGFDIEAVAKWYEKFYLGCV